MRIEKSLNNNVAVVLDGQGAEKIVMGKGSALGKKQEMRSIPRW